MTEEERELATVEEKRELPSTISQQPLPPTAVARSPRRRLAMSSPRPWRWRHRRLRRFELSTPINPSTTPGRRIKQPGVGMAMGTR
jgi:hypothetical protein